MKRSGTVYGLWIMAANRGTEDVPPGWTIESTWETVEFAWEPVVVEEPLPSGSLSALIELNYPIDVVVAADVPLRVTLSLPDGLSDCTPENDTGNALVRLHHCSIL